MTSPEDRTSPCPPALTSFLFLDIAKFLRDLQDSSNCSKGVILFRNQTLKCKISVEAYDSSLFQISHLENKTSQNWENKSLICLITISDTQSLGILSKLFYFWWFHIPQWIVATYCGCSLWKITYWINYWWEFRLFCETEEKYLWTLFPILNLYVCIG